MRMNRWTGRMMLAGLLCVGGCSQERAAQMEQVEVAAADAAAPTASAPAPETAPPAVDPGDIQTQVGAAQDPARRFVVTASARFKVADVYQSALAIEDAAAAEGGFVLRNAISAEPGAIRTQPLGNGRLLRLTEFTRTGEVVVRLPVARTQAFLRGIVARMEFMDEREVTAVDVQFDELRQRLASARAADAQDRIGQAARQPGKLGEKVEAEDVRYQRAGDRDEAQLRRRELEDRIAFSTVTLDLYQASQLRKETVLDPGAAMRIEGPGFRQRLATSMQAGWQGLLSLLLGLAALWPLWSLLGLALGLWWRRHRLRWPRRSPLPTPPAG